jgi:hypothetical protein
MNDFLKFIEGLVTWFPVHVEITYSKRTDWQILVTKKGCASDYPESPHVDDDVILCCETSIDMELCFAQAQVAVKEWLSEYNGGY